MTASPPGAGENFIPYSQIEPLIVEGMTARQLGRAVVRRAGLAEDGRYMVLTIARGFGPLPELLRDGLEIVTADEGRRRYTIDRFDEPVR